jgi:hypothetical protein
MEVLRAVLNSQFVKIPVCLTVPHRSYARYASRAPKHARTLCEGALQNKRHKSEVMCEMFRISLQISRSGAPGRPENHRQV